MERDETLIAHHEAGHAIALHSAGIGIVRVTTEPDAENGGMCEPVARASKLLGLAPGRADVEHAGIILHAGSAAERILRPEEPMTHARTDHRCLHFLLQEGEEDSATQITWCSYIWQRAYALLADPWKWKLVVLLAGELLQRGTLRGAEVIRFLDHRASSLKRDPKMPNCKLLGGPPVRVRSPWHPDWYDGGDERMQPRYEIFMEPYGRVPEVIKPRPRFKRRRRKKT